jgi:catechol 2,3-dioxygenase-like lactoylglutathione lyase family enzyme
MAQRGARAVSPAGPRLDLDHSVLAVSDWERSNAFYRDVLGVEVIPLESGRYVYRLANTQLNVHGPGAPAGELARIPVAPGGSDLCFVWPDSSERAVEHLEAHGVEIEVGPVPRFGAQGHGTSVYFRDPDGSLLELISYTEVERGS